MTLTVTMKRDVLYAGTLLANGSSQSLPDDFARQLQYEGRAVINSVDPLLIKRGAAQTNTNPDGSFGGLSDAAGNMVKVPYLLAQSAVPVILPSSGSSNAPSFCQAQAAAMPLGRSR